MMNNEDNAWVDLESQLLEKLQLGQDLLASLSDPNLQRVHGLAKLEKKIRQELKFLQKFQRDKRNKLKKEHLSCSNLVHLTAIVGVLLDSKCPTSVLTTFPFDYDSTKETKKVIVDVVSEEGFSWTKVVARNPKALDLNSSGGNQFGQRSLLDQVKEYLNCAKQNPKLFRIPEVTFVFHNGISENLKKRLEKRGLLVKGEVIPADSTDQDLNSEEDSELDDVEDSDEETTDSDSDVVVKGRLDYKMTGDNSDELDTNCINLDITAMIAYVSALTNGNANHTFKEPVLSKQARWEQQNPVKPFLDELFQNKQLVCCESAMTDFKTILNTLGGEGEKERADRLFQKIKVVPDMMTDRLRHLDLSGKIKERSIAIFGTGDFLRVLTVSANSGFVRASKGQGVELAVVLHESRALAEDKILKSQMRNCDHKE